MKRIYIPGVWDLFHIGHLNALKEAAKYGDHLTVGICSDDLCIRTKGKPIIDQYSRLSIIESLRIVDSAVIYKDLEYFPLIKRLGIDIFAIGPEFGYLPQHKIALDLCRKNNINILRIPRLENISSSIIKAKIKDK